MLKLHMGQYVIVMAVIYNSIVVTMSATILKKNPTQASKVNSSIVYPVRFTLFLVFPNS